MHITTYLQTTVEIMHELHIPIRDTYNSSENLDDYYTNGNSCHGPRQLNIDWSESVEYPSTRSRKLYNPQGYQSVAYDKYSIVMPVRYKVMNRQDAIIHELVHFLQHNTLEEDRNYINYDGKNYKKYLNQRVELEAHAVQVWYIMKHNPERWNKYLTADDQKYIEQAFLNLTKGSNISNVFNVLLLCKEKSLI